MMGKKEKGRKTLTSPSSPLLSMVILLRYRPGGGGGKGGEGGERGREKKREKEKESSNLCPFGAKFTGTCLSASLPDRCNSKPRKRGKGGREKKRRGKEKDSRGIHKRTTQITLLIETLPDYEWRPGRGKKGRGRGCRFARIRFNAGSRLRPMIRTP